MERVLLQIDVFLLDMTFCALCQFRLFIVGLKLCPRLRVPFSCSLFELGIILYKYSGALIVKKEAINKSIVTAALRDAGLHPFHPPQPPLLRKKVD